MAEYQCKLKDDELPNINLINDDILLKRIFDYFLNNPVIFNNYQMSHNKNMIENRQESELIPRLARTFAGRGRFCQSTKHVA